MAVRSRERQLPVGPHCNQRKPVHLMKTNLIPVALVAVLLCDPRPMFAQGAVGQSTGSVAEALERFEQDASAPRPVSPVGLNWLLRIVRRASEPAKVDSVLYGIEQKALGSTNDRVRSGAASFLSVAGKSVADHDSHPVLPRLIRVYRESADPTVRATVIGGMLGQRPEAEAIAFLKDVATSTPGRTNPEFADEPWEAVSALSHMGDAGLAAVRELQSRGNVPDWKAKGVLDYLARRGFRPEH
jgi:hypothetical protein